MPMEWPLLRPLPGDARQAVIAAARLRRFSKGDIVFHQGDPADALHLLVSGRLAVQVFTAEGDRATINVLGPGDHVGELALVPSFSRQPRSATVVALEAAETRVLSATAFTDLCDRHPVVHDVLVELLAERIRELSEELLHAMYLGVDQRLYRRLAVLAEEYRTAPGPITVPLTQEQLADLTGGTRQTVNQVLQRLASQGVVELARGRVVVVDLPRLRRKAGLL